MYILDAGLESPEHIGRGERHGDFFKKDFKTCIKYYEIIGQERMNIAAAICCETNQYHSEKRRHQPPPVGVGVNPRIPRLMTEEEELKQLGVL